MLLEPFYQFHPGADITEQLFEERHLWIKKILEKPHSALELLSEKYKFGNKSDFWDDFVFLLVISPAIAEICALPDLRSSINRYSELDHALFRLYIRRDEDPVRFRRAFWNVNSYGKQLSARFMQQFCRSSDIKKFPLKIESPYLSTSPYVYKLALVFKGKFALAHAEFLHEFLRGTKQFASKVKLTLILLDDSGSRLQNTGVDHVEIVSFKNCLGTYEKLENYYNFLLSAKFDHISWIACVQSLSLFMGQRLAPTQSYWSMKYHSIIMNSLDKYAGLGFGGDSFKFDDINWFRGRAFPKLSIPSRNEQLFAQFKRERNIANKSIIAGCFVRSEKLNNPSFWQLIARLLEECPDLHFVIASQSLPNLADEYLLFPSFRSKFHHLGWINTKKVCQYLDIYIDSFPRGSCLTALEAIKAGVPVVMFDTQHNRESSALPYLISAAGGELPPGILGCENISSSHEFIRSLILSKSKRMLLAKHQSQLLKSLEGRSALYAKDYLNYFLDTSFSVSEVVSR